MKCKCGRDMRDVSTLYGSPFMWFCQTCSKISSAPPAHPKEVKVSFGFSDTAKTEHKTPAETERCKTCKKRETYVWCSRCSAPLCAMCSWTMSVPRPGKNGIVDERCRGCAHE